MPDPGEKETHEEWMSRCMGDEEQRRSFPDEAQRQAVCESKWRQHMKDDATNQAPMPEEGESESEYMARCQDGGHSERECRMMWEEEGMMDAAPTATVRLRIRNDGAAELLLYGVIGADSWFGDGITAKAFRAEIKKVKSKTLNLRINSEGGSVTEAAAMLNALDEFKGRIEVDIDGLAASAASFVAMGGDTIRVATNGLIMIHEPMTMALGRAEDMRRTADLLDKVREQILDAYERKSKAGRDKLAAWMTAETWFSGQEAVAAGLADSVTEPMRMAARADPKVLAKLGYKRIPASVLKAKDDEAARLAAETARRREIAARL